MERQPEDKIDEEPRVAAVVHLLAWLNERDFTPGPLLARIFSRAVELYPIGEAHPVITSSTIFFAAYDIGLEVSGADADERALARYSALLSRSRDQLEQIRTDLLAKRPRSREAPYQPKGWTRSVETSLENAWEKARRRERVGILSAWQFLLEFPAPDSTAANILKLAGIDRTELRQALEQGASPPPPQSPPRTRTDARPAEVEAPEGFEALPETIELEEALKDFEARPETIAREAAVKGFATEPTESEVTETAETEATEAVSSEPATPPRTDEPLSVNDRVSTHADEPALIDQLERAPFAACLAQNIREARRSGETGAAAFIVHLHGPWGSGKSSVLNFLEADLTGGDDPWLVVRFNAWRDQRRQPPWWSLITCIYAGARSNPDKEAAKRLWWRWFKWRVRADFMPWAIAAGLVLLCIGLLILGVTTSIAPTVTAVGGVITLIGAGAVAIRSLALGSQKAAQTYAELKADPFQPITGLFDSLIKAVGRPVAVFIDDLDRCDSTYVVDLLEGIQTLMRSAPVTYVVAADRKWICSSFEQKYARFSPPIGEPGRPLGYLFLDKIFQISAAVPQLATDIRETYWAGLLTDTGGLQDDAVRQAADDARHRADEDARERLAGLSTHEELRDAVDRAEQTEDPVAIQAVRAEAAMRITSAEASAKAEHRLKPYACLIEPNPRSMKRLVNAYGMHQATLFLAGRAVPPGALARWTILELRWPLLADFLAVRPAFVDRLGEPLGDEDLKFVPERLRDLFGDEMVAEVCGAGSPEQCLDVEAVRAILGSVQGDR